MNQSIRRIELMDSFQKLKGQFDKSLQTAKDQEQQFEVLRKQFIDQVENRLDAALARLPKTSPIHDLVVDFIGKMQATKADWNATVDGRERGVRFRAGFEDSLMVFVNGKVKSGKSSLGNYMAWGDTDPTSEHKRSISATLAPDFFSGERATGIVGDTDGEAERLQEFRVGALEATARIQCFALPGLTWVDSPGMHSLNPDHEAVARSYVDHADLILYPMKSDAPGRASDMVEVRSLIGKGKEVLLLLTGSDDIETDVDDNGQIVSTVIMKNPVARAMQRDYVRKVVEQDCGADVAAQVRIVSISARYAQLHADSPAEFADSGLGELCGTLDRIARDEAVRIKRRTPIANLHTFLLACRVGLQPYGGGLAGLQSKRAEMKASSDKQINVIVHRAQAELQAFVDLRFEQIESQRAHADLKSVLPTLQKVLNAQIRQIAINTLDEMFKDIMAEFASAMEQSYVDSGMASLPDFQVEKVIEKIPHIQVGTRTRNGFLGSLLLGGIGLIVGGPAGAALGASIGGGIGGATGDSASTRYSEIELTVGDNLQQIRFEALRSAQAALETQIRGSAANLWSMIGVEVDGLSEALAGDITRFDAQLKRLIQTTEKELRS